MSRLGLPRSIPAASKLPQNAIPRRRRIQDVEKIVAVSSAKGGVGKSTIAANLSLAFAKRGLRIGILDTDIFGPSIPTLFNLKGEPRLSDANFMLPLTNYGVKTMSMGYLMQDNAPAVWRGPMVMNSVQQLLHKVDWGGLDVLVLDLPPGTGDVQLTITQQLELDGAVIVSTPQDLALKDAIRGVEMFKKVNVPILGLAENMAHFTCPVCSSRTSIFASSSSSSASHEDHKSPSDAVHAKRHSPLWSSLNIPLLGSIPLAPRICSDADAGLPTVVAQPRSESALAFEELAGRVLQELGIAE